MCITVPPPGYRFCVTPLVVASDNAAVCPKGLSVDPGSVGTDEERDDSGYILGTAETLQRSHLCHVRDLLGRFAVEEQIGGRRPGRHGVHGNLAAAKFFREDVGWFLFSLTG